MRVRIKANFENAGKKGSMIRPDHITCKGVEYTPVIWDGDREPVFHKYNELFFMPDAEHEYSDKCLKDVLTGVCCCNCLNQRELMCHPWNKDFGKGYKEQRCGWVCTDTSNQYSLEYTDYRNGICEQHKKAE